MEMINMNRGISFKLKPINHALWQILKCINVEKYNWYNIESQNEVWANYNGGIGLEKNYYDGKSFLQNITSDHYIIFIKLQAYLKDGKFFDIHTYDEFIKSDCQIILLINDCEFVEIYLKDQHDINILYHHMMEMGFKDIKYISDINDGRTKMDVL